MNRSPTDARLLCLTPTRNERWIIEPFIAAAKSWANGVIVADQLSTDGTREFLAADDQVDLIANDTPTFDEKRRQELLLSRARQYAGKRILIGLDADEALSANFVVSPDWHRICDAEPGTVLRFRWVNILPGFRYAWISAQRLCIGFVDDGTPHEARTIHSPRVPRPPNAPILDLHDVVVLHFQFVLWERMLSKQRWYQVWESLNGGKGALDVFRQYHHMHGSWQNNELHPVKPEWLEGYDAAGVDFRRLTSEPVTWWDRDIIDILRRHGTSRFRKVAIWDQDWNAVANRVGIANSNFDDPRSPWLRTIHWLLKATQARRSTFPVRVFERALRLNGW